MQSNANKLRTLLRQVKWIQWPLGIALIVFPKFNDYNTISTIIGIISIIFTFLWFLFDRFLWKNKTLNSNLKLSKTLYTPVIEGRWEGTLTRNGKKHKFVIEIKQSFTTISCETYSRHGYSASECAELLYDTQNDTYRLVFLWKGKTTNTEVDGADSTNYFYGTTILNINSQCNQLDGDYFTDRQPNQTRGKINLTFRQKELNNSF